MHRMTKRFFPGDTVLVTIGMVPTGTHIMTPHTLMTTVERVKKHKVWVTDMDGPVPHQYVRRA